ncbi:glycosyltransferase 61 family protein [Mycobacterium sp. HUMS_1102779]|uniref:glycosyltransferase 61 family protein n=1 Tax=Mycobacterium sp. HUMS_1102779 TaxID=3383487 RepID=UPI0038997F19
MHQFIHTTNSFRLLGVPYLDFLAALHTHLTPRTYLEVGTARGDSLELAGCDAIAVDPGFQLEVTATGKRRRTFFFQMTSDDFFTTENVRELLGRPVDMAFLDGLHRFEFLLRDLIGTEAACHPRSLILLHDCVPLNPRMALRQWLPGGPLETETASFWTGDVWKLLPILKKYRPDLRLHVLDCPPTGLVAITRLDPASRILADSYYDIVDEYAATVMDDNRLRSFWEELEMTDSRPLCEEPDRLTSLFSLMGSPLPPPQFPGSYRGGAGREQRGQSFRGQVVSDLSQRELQPLLSFEPAGRSMSAAQLLVPCTSVIGASDIRETIPKVLECTEVMYLPYRNPGPWGIYDAQGMAIEGAINFRGPWREPRHQSVTVTPEPAEAICNEADLVYVGEIMDHFGHFLTQSLSRFWYLRERPSARVLFHSMWNATQLFSFQHVAQIFEALGLREEQFVRFEVPTLVQSLTVPQPSLEEMHFAHQIYAECLREIGAFFTQGDVHADEGPVYLSKTRLNVGVRRFVNEQEIEDELARQGVRIVHPETLSLPQQIDTLRRHRTLLGCCGSAFHSTLMLPEGRRIVGLNEFETLNSNFELFDKLSGNNASYYYAPSTKQVDDPKFLVASRIDDPVGVARELLQRI